MVNVLHLIIAHSFNNDEEDQDESRTPTLFERLKCEFKNENNGRKMSWGTLSNL
jgi:hypothetical protein